MLVLAMQFSRGGEPAAGVAAGSGTAEVAKGDVPVRAFLGAAPKESGAPERAGNAATEATAVRSLKAEQRVRTLGASTGGRNLPPCTPAERPTIQ
jgi:hypothetical protein